MRFSKTLLGSFASLVFAAGCSSLGSESSPLSGDDVQAGDCTLTQGYWKNHPEAWPVSSLELGESTYSKDALIAILKTPVKGNGLIKLAHQLIAAKLNVAAGANDAPISVSITAADDLIGDLVVGEDALESKAVSELNDKLDAFNNGITGPGHCDKQPSCENDDDGDGECDAEDDDDCDHDADGDCDGSDDHDCDGDCDHDDDGDCDDGDHDCDHDDDGHCDGEPAPVCGDDTVDAGETCDDGNAIDLDGCSASCQIELPICGDGLIEGTEECDDGNLVNGDGCSSVCVCDTPLH